LLLDRALIQAFKERGIDRQMVEMVWSRPLLAATRLPALSELMQHWLHEADLLAGFTRIGLEHHACLELACQSSWVLRTIYHQQAARLRAERGLFAEMLKPDEFEKYAFDRITPFRSSTALSIWEELQREAASFLPLGY